MNDARPNGPETKPLEYLLELEETEKATGFFVNRPKEELGFEQFLSRHREAPNDEFMRRHLIRFVGEWSPERLKKAATSEYAGDPFALSLLYDACLLNSKFESVRKHFDKADVKKFSQHSPLIFVRSYGLKDYSVHSKWIRMFRRNLFEHHPMESPEKIGLEPPFSREELEPFRRKAASIDELFEPSAPPAFDAEAANRSAGETFDRAMGILDRIGIVADKEMRHVSSLSPIGLLRKWKLRVSVHTGRHRYEMSGIQTSYGRGLELEAARAAYAMEMLERYASFANADQDGIVGYRKDFPLEYARFSGMKRENMPALDPNRLRLEVPYRDEPIFWIEGELASEEKPSPVWVPAQCVFLFFNLDEIKLFSGLGSTGLASGNTMAEAKRSALLEIVERDCEATVPYDPAKCFDIETRDPKLRSLLVNYAEAGIRVQFQDLTTPMGVPCCKCFVVAPDGEVVKGTSAHLDAKRALVSAMTETAYPFPYGQPSGPGLENILRVPVENLPNYGSGDAEKDVELLETLLIRNGHRPIYVDLTREDTGVSVVRAVVPGMETYLDFDRFSRVPPRLYLNYLETNGR